MLFQFNRDRGHAPSFARCDPGRWQTTPATSDMIVEKLRPKVGDETAIVLTVRGGGQTVATIATEAEPCKVPPLALADAAGTVHRHQVPTDAG